MTIHNNPSSTNKFQWDAKSAAASLKASDTAPDYTISTQNPMGSDDMNPVASELSTYSLPTKLKQELAGRPLRVEILECSGGQGHKKSADAVKKAVQEHFAQAGISVEFKRKDVGSHMAPDPLGKVTFGKYHMIDLHNYLARHGKTKIIKLLTNIGKFVHKIHFPFNVKYFKKRLEKQQSKGKTPDLIISAVPLVNGPLLKGAASRDIPVMVVTTDADNALFSVNWPSGKNVPAHRYGIPYNSLEIVEKVNSAVDPKNIRGIGYPVRSEFLKEYSSEDLELFREELGIEKGKKTVGVMMGGLGGVVTLKYFQQMARGIEKSALEDLNTHFTYFCGTNHEMHDTLVHKAEKAGFERDSEFKGEGTKMVHPSGASISIVGFTKNVHKHMALADCWVTKPGSSSFNECLCMAVPMLLDYTAEPLPWEDLNVDLAETYQFGERVTSFDQFVTQLNTVLEPENNEKYHASMVEYRQDRPHQKQFGKNIVKLTYELLNEAAEKREEKAQAAEALAKQQSSAATKGARFRSRCSRFFKKMGRTALRVAKLAIKCIFGVVVFLNWAAKKLTARIIDFAFFSSFNLNKKTKALRRKELIRGIRHTKEGKVRVPHTAKPLEGGETPLYSEVSKRPLDALYIESKAKNRTGNAVIYVLAKEYQSFNPKNYDHLLDDGADVVLFNPSAKNAKTMASDLKALIKELRRRNPEQSLALSGYSIGAHVAASVASDIANGVEGMKQESLPVIVDRGYGDGQQLARKVTRLAGLPFAKKHINRHYNNNTLEKVAKHTGDMLFLTTKDGNDQMLHKRLKKGKVLNLTRELSQKHKNGSNKVIEMENADHWTPWTWQVQNKVKGFLQKQGIVTEGYTKFDEQNTGGFPQRTSVPWFRRKVLPLLV